MKVKKQQKYEEAMDIVRERLLNYIDIEEGDLLERLWKLMFMSFEIINEQSCAYEVLRTIYLNNEDELQAMKAELDGIWRLDDGALVRGIDYSYFRGGTDIQNNINMIKWTLQGYLSQLLNKGVGLEDFDQIIEDVRGYMKSFRQMFYY